MATDKHQRNDQHAREQAKEIWHGFLAGDLKDFSFRLRGMIRLFEVLPSDPRCRICHVPFAGIGGMIARTMGRGEGRASKLNPKLCARCEHFIHEHEVGTEIEMSLLFADVRGSTTLAEEVGVDEFRRLIDRFYRATTDVLVEHNALIEKMVGDEITGVFVRGIAGPDYVTCAVKAAQTLLCATGHDQPGGPWIPVGVGVHTGRAYVGSVGHSHSVNDFTVLGDTANTAARITAQAGAGEILVSEATVEAAGLDVSGLAERRLELKGRSEPVVVWALRVSAPELT